uniref:Lipocalin n=1 Tax=Rhipicephalus zambeziensis TaxID=60191 RepID=A0A224YBF8_9ACAR
MYTLLGILITVATSLCSNISSKCEVSDAAEKVLPVVNVFNTSEPLWFYQKSSTSGNAPVTCIVLGMINVTKSDYYAWQNETFRKDLRLSERCHGTFKNGTREKLGMMNFSCDDTGSNVLYEEMELMYADQNCSIFIVTVPSLATLLPHPTCRMYIPDNAVDNGPTTNCSDFFNTNCTGKPAVFYNKTCRTL